MGEIDERAFLQTCLQRFPKEEAQVQATTLCSLWQENLKNPDWHPFKIITSIEGNHQVQTSSSSSVFILPLRGSIFSLIACDVPSAGNNK